MAPYSDAVLPAGIRSRFVEGVNGLTVHVLEAWFETPGRPMLILLHGFPELAYSWRKVMPRLAAGDAIATGLTPEPQPTRTRDLHERLLARPQGTPQRPNRTLR